MNKQRENKITYLSHPSESAAAYLDVWDAEGDSLDLAGRRSSNMRHQNLRRLTERRRRPAVPHRQRHAAPPATGCHRPVVPSSPSYGCSSSPFLSSSHRPPYLSNNL
jgi:hypothetical protein